MSSLRLPLGMVLHIHETPSMRRSIWNLNPMYEARILAPENVFPVTPSKWLLELYSFWKSFLKRDLLLSAQQSSS
jgi:hypothetical protein